MSDIYITVTDYSATESVVTDDGYEIIPGIIDNVKSASSKSDTELGVTKLLCQNYMRWRIAHIIVLTMLDNDLDRYRKVSFTMLDTITESILDHYTLDHEVFMINLIPYQINKLSDISIEADTNLNIFKRFDFIDIGCKIHDMNIPEYVSIRCNGIGSVGITENFKENW